MRRFTPQRDRPPQPREIVTLAVSTYFIIVAARVFERFPSVHYVWFAEDDRRFRSCVTVEKLLHAAEHGTRTPVWLGYGLRKRAPEGRRSLGQLQLFCAGGVSERCNGDGSMRTYCI